MGKQLKKTKNEKDKSQRYQANVVANTSYFEISAKEPDNVNNVFKSLLTKITQNGELIEKIKMSNQPDKIRLSNVGGERPVFKKFNSEKSDK
jgi:GTPase SAR1 family protein